VESHNSITLESALRLDAIAKYLGVGKQWGGQDSEKEVVHACLEKVSGLFIGLEPTGEALAARTAKHYQVNFEEVRQDEDITALEQKYLVGKKELGFARLREEIHSPNVDALLFQRINANPDDPDRWVAVLNLTITEDRAYWNRYHEISHRLAEPPQKILPFRRETTDNRDVVEKMIDTIAGEVAFHPRLFSPYMANLKTAPATFEAISAVRNAYSPSASLLAVTNAIVQRMERPAVAFVASMKAKRNGPQNQKDLRIEPQCRNALAQASDLYLIPNMRVPRSSCAYHSFLTGCPMTSMESTRDWTTSSGKAIPQHHVTVSTIKLRDRIYGIMTI
jgi:hypothetical protein